MTAGPPCCDLCKCAGFRRDRLSEIGANILLLQMACRHGYPVRVYAKLDGDDEPCAYDGWVRGSETPTSVTLCEGKQEHVFEFGQIEDASFFTPWSERLTGEWLRENL